MAKTLGPTGIEVRSNDESALKDEGAIRTTPTVGLTHVPHPGAWSTRGPFRVDLRKHSGILTEPFRHVSLARIGISEPRERFAKIEIAIPTLEAKGRQGKTAPPELHPKAQLVAASLSSGTN